MDEVRIDIKAGFKADEAERGAEQFAETLKRRLKEARQAVEDFRTAAESPTLGMGKGKLGTKESGLLPVIEQQAQRTVERLSKLQGAAGIQPDIQKLEQMMAQIRSRGVPVVGDVRQLPAFQMFQAALQSYKPAEASPTEQRAMKSLIETVRSKAYKDVRSVESSMLQTMSQELADVEKIEDPAAKANKRLELREKHERMQQEMLQSRIQMQREEEAYQQIREQGIKAVKPRIQGPLAESVQARLVEEYAQKPFVIAEREQPSPGVPTIEEQARERAEVPKTERSKATAIEAKAKETVRQKPQESPAEQSMRAAFVGIHAKDLQAEAQRRQAEFAQEERERVSAIEEMPEDQRQQAKQQHEEWRQERLREVAADVSAAEKAQDLRRRMTNKEEPDRARIMGPLATSIPAQLIASYLKEIDRPAGAMKQKVQDALTGGVNDPVQRQMLISHVTGYAKQMHREYARRQDEFVREEQERMGLIAGLPSEDERKAAMGELNAWRKERLNGLQTDAREIARLDGIVGGFNDRVTRSGRMLPAYVGTVLNTVGQAGQMYANLYRAERTMFDLSSPEGMANAMMSLNIYKTQAYSRGIASTIGAVGGGIIGGFAGGPFAPATALAGTYLGSQIATPIGEMVATYLSADREAQQKLFNTFFPKSMANVQAFAPVQSAEYTLAARTGWKTRPEQYEAAFKGYGEKFGLGPAEVRQAALAQIEARGRATGTPEEQQAQLETLLKVARANRIDPSQVMALSGISRFTGRELVTGAGTPRNPLDLTEIAKMMAVPERLGMPKGSPMALEFMKSIPSYFQAAARVFTRGSEIERAALTQAQMPRVLFGERIEDQNDRGMDWARTPQGRQQVEEAMAGLARPKNAAEQAFLFTALRAANPKADVMETMLKMQEGITGKGNLEAIYKALPRGKMGEAMMFALTEGKVENVDLRRQMMKAAGSDEGVNEILKQWRDNQQQAEKPNFSEKQQREFGKSLDITDKIPDIERAQAKIAESNAEAGRQVKDFYNKLTVEYNDWLNSVTVSASVQREIAKLLEGVRDRSKEILKESGWVNWSDLASPEEKARAEQHLSTIRGRKGSDVTRMSEEGTVNILKRQRQEQLDLIEPIPAHSIGREQVQEKMLKKLNIPKSTSSVGFVGPTDPHLLDLTVPKDMLQDSLGIGRTQTRPRSRGTKTHRKTAQITTDDGQQYDVEVETNVKLTPKSGPEPMPELRLPEVPQSRRDSVRIR